MKIKRLLKIISPNRDWFPIKPISLYDGTFVTMTRKEWGEHLSLLKYLRAKVTRLEGELAALMDHAAAIGTEIEPKEQEA